MCQQLKSLTPLHNLLRMFMSNVTRGFRSLKLLREYSRLSNPFLDTNNFGDPELDSELDLLRCKLANALFKSIHKDKGQLEFYPHLDSAKFPLLIKYLKRIVSIYGTTYNCEASFSRLNLIKTEQRSRVSNKSLTNLMSIETCSLPYFISKGTQ